MKLQLDIPDELYDDLILCVESKGFSLNEYIIVSIGTAVSRDLKTLFAEEIEEGQDDVE